MSVLCSVRSSFIQDIFSPFSLNLKDVDLFCFKMSTFLPFWSMMASFDTDCFKVALVINRKYMINDVNRIQFCCNAALDNSVIIQLKSVRCLFSSVQQLSKINYEMRIHL